jgi:thiamine biosynthesis lipoprotein
VLHRDATTADAAATALFVAGAEHWQEVARAMGLRHVMLIDASGVAHLSPAMAARIRFETDPPPPARLGESLP